MYQNRIVTRFWHFAKCKHICKPKPIVRKALSEHRLMSTAVYRNPMSSGILLPKCFTLSNHNEQFSCLRPTRENCFANIRRNYTDLKEFTLIESGPKYMASSLLDRAICWMKMQYVRRFIDKTIEIKGFVKAITVVSSLLAAGKFDELKGLLDDKVLETVQMNYDRLDPSLRKYLEIKPNDAYFVHLKNVKLKSTKDRKIMVEVLFVAHKFQGGFQEFTRMIQEAIQSAEPDMKMLPLLVVSNYRFIRLYDTNADSEWTVNYLNCLARTWI